MPLQMLELLAQVQHPNIADILDVYFYDGQLCIVSEYLDVSLLDLEFNRLAPEEWEIATIVAEVTLLCFLRPEIY
jgi:serine/threonine protein kinase